MILYLIQLSTLQYMSNIDRYTLIIQTLDSHSLLLDSQLLQAFEPSVNEEHCASYRGNH